MKGCNVGQKGGEELFTTADLEEIHASITHSAMTLDGKSNEEVKELLQFKLLEKRGYNAFADKDKHAPIEDRTVKKYMKIMTASEREGKVKPESRIEPYLNIRNAISKAAGLTALAKVCPVENMHSDDEVGLMLFGWNETKPKLVSTKEADEWLRRNNVSLSTSGEPNQQRCAHIGTCQQPSRGGLTCFYLRIQDSNFPEVFRHDDPTVHKPIVMRLNPKTCCYLVLCNPLVTDTVISEYIGKLIICPAMFDKQDETIRREIEGANHGDDTGMVYGSQSQPEPPSAIADGINFALNCIKCLFVILSNFKCRCHQRHQRKVQIYLSAARWLLRADQCSLRNRCVGKSKRSVVVAWEIFSWNVYDRVVQ